MAAAATLTAILTTPLLALLAIPLLLSACITTSVSILVLSLRISVFYIELCYAIAAKYFVVPAVAANESSLLSFVASEPGTPGIGVGVGSKNRVLSAGLDGCQYQRGQYSNDPSTAAVMDKLSPFSSSSTTTAEATAAVTASTPLQNFVSDDERRDFEGVGGWHCGTHPGFGIVRASTSTSPVWRQGLTPNRGQRRHHRRSVTAPMAQGQGQFRAWNRNRSAGGSHSGLSSSRSSEPGDYFGLGSGG